MGLTQGQVWSLPGSEVSPEATGGGVELQISLWAELNPVPHPTTTVSSEATERYGI